MNNLRKQSTPLNDNFTIPIELSEHTGTLALWAERLDVWS